jgi:hypothetical protein
MPTEKRDRLGQLLHLGAEFAAGTLGQRWIDHHRFENEYFGVG